MMIEIKVPLLPESVADATVTTWYKKVGERVKQGDNIVDLETDKVMLEVASPAEGILKEILKDLGSVVQAQMVLAIVESSVTGHTLDDGGDGDRVLTSQAMDVHPNHSVGNSPSKLDSKDSKEKTDDLAQKKNFSELGKQPPPLLLSPSARRAAIEHHIDISRVQGTGKRGRITKENILAALESQNENHVAPLSESASTGLFSHSLREEKRVPMSRIRMRIADHLLSVQQQAAMLTTFNEVNMTSIMQIRHRYRESFEKKHQVRLGFMSFFVLACVEALKQFPIINASIDHDHIIYHDYFDVGVAVSTDRGLVVPVLRDVNQMTMAEIEKNILTYAQKAKAGRLSLEEMQGGNFTITNGGVFGSLLSTPILNLPQCAILGMHKIQERPVVEEGEIVIRPMMYLALSYDHCLVDGKESVTFLATIKALLEDPLRLLLEV